MARVKVFRGFVIFLLSLVLFSQPLFAAPPGDQSQWTITFSDEFDGSSLDTTKWATYRSDGGRNIADAQSWCIDSNVSVSGGALRLKATNIQSHSGYPYSGSCVSGHNAFNQMYGYFESSMKLPKGAGMWPAFWLMPKSSNNSWLWPPEIDIMENLGAYTNVVYMTNHYSSNYPQPGIGHGQTGGVYSGVDYSAAFHTFGVLWDSSQVVWYIDDIQRFRVTDYVPITGYGWPGMYILFDLAVGGSWGGPPNSSTPWPSEYLVDWVRVYQKSTGPIPPGSPKNLRLK